MPLYKIRLELAREPEFPAGNKKRGYELVLPLDAAMKIDAAEWKKHPEACTVERFWDGEFAALGYLEKHPKGQWVFDYDLDADDDDEAGFRLGEHSFNTGEYVSISAHDGKMHTFTVVSATPQR